MGKRSRKQKRGGRVTPKGTRPEDVRSARPGPPRDREPDLLDDVADALGTGSPLDLLALSSGLVDALTGPRSPFDPPLELPPAAEVVRSFVEIPCPETTALLATLAVLLPDEVAARAARQELERRSGDPIPAWLAGLDRAEVARVVEVADLLGDASNIMVELVLADGSTLTVLAYVDHGAGSVVADAFVIPDRLDAVLALMGDADGAQHMTSTAIDPADARVRIEDGVRHGAMTLPPYETDSWPGCRPLLLWVAGLLPEGGALAERPEWSEADEQALVEAFLASEEGRVFDDPDHRDLLGTLLWLGTGYGSGDPLRWSPTRVDELLLDLVPRKVMAPPTHLAKVPSLLVALVGYGHRQRGIPADLTAETISAVHRIRPEFEDAIADPDRPRGAAAIAAQALGLAGAASPALSDMWHAELARIEQRAGGPEALAALDLDPLPDEALDLTGVPDDVVERVREVAALCDGGCDALLGVEARTACRRLVARLGREGPDAFRRRGRSDTAAAALCWAVGRASDLIGPDGGQVTAKVLQAHFGLTGSISTRAGTLLRTAGLDTGRGDPVMLPLGMLTASARRSMVEDASRLRALLATARDAAPALPFPGPSLDGPTQLVLEVTLDVVQPPIWRRLEVDGATTFAGLHDIVQIAFGWHDEHLHAFTVDDRSIVPDPIHGEWSSWGGSAVDEATVTVADALALGTPASYTYDFGDGWEHSIEVVSVAPRSDDVVLPRCTGGGRAGPPEDVGGPWGYEELLEVLADPDHPERDDRLEWLGGPIDPERFDAAAVNAALRRLDRS